MIQLFQPSLGAEELESLRRVFATNWVGRGPVTREFEQSFAAHIGAHSSLIRSVSCCTEGLFQAVELLGLTSGDEVVLPTISFVGAAHAVAACGATPVFCDIDPRTLNATAETLAACVTSRTRALLVLHYGGLPCEMDGILDLAQQRGLMTVEDSACSVASTWRGQMCGTLGDVGTWSFDAMKILVTGDGGMVYCRTPEMAAELERQIYLGLNESSGFSNPASSRWWELEVTSVGRRAIMNDIASAIGLEQLRKLPAFVGRRKQIHETYTSSLSRCSWLRTPPDVPTDCTSSYYLYWVQVDRSDVRDRLAGWLRERDIYSSFRYQPVHRLPLYGGSVHLPHADQAADTTLCLPLHQGLTDDDVTRVISAVADFGRTL